MGERYDVTVTLGDGVFPLVASAEGKHGQALALVRTGSGRVPGPRSIPTELGGRVPLGTDLVAADSVRLAPHRIDAQHDVLLSGSMKPYRWTINGRPYPDSAPRGPRRANGCGFVF